MTLGHNFQYGNYSTESLLFDTFLVTTVKNFFCMPAFVSYMKSFYEYNNYVVNITIRKKEKKILLLNEMEMCIDVLNGHEKCTKCKYVNRYYL